MMVWLMPIMILGREIGICTLNRVCSLEEPKEWAASMVSLGIWRIPRLVRRITGGSA